MACGMSRALAHVNHTQHDCSAIPEAKGGRVSHTYVCGIYPHMACFRWPAYHSRGWRRWGCMLVLGMVGSARLPRQHCFLRLSAIILAAMSELGHAFGVSVFRHHGRVCSLPFGYGIPALHT